MLKKFWGLFLGLMMSGGLLITPALAADTNLPYTVTIKTPAQQIGQVKYFNVQGKPNEVIKLPLTIKNNTNKSYTLLSEPNNATTSDKLIVDYSDHNAHKINDNTYDLTDMMSGPLKVTLNKHETITNTFSLTLPPKNFAGLVLGSIRISDVNDPGQPGFVTAVMVRMHSRSVSPQLKITAVDITTKNKNPTLRLTVQNPRPVLLTNAKLKGSFVRLDHSQKTLATMVTDNKRSLAPSSEFHVFIPYTEKQRLQAGKYQVNLQVNSGQGTAKTTKTFTLSQQLANNTNKQLGLTWKDSFWNNYTFWFGGIIIFAVIIIGGIIVYKKRAQNDFADQDPDDFI